MGLVADRISPQAGGKTPTNREVSVVGLAVECSGLTLISPHDEDVDALMAVYSDDFDFSGTTKDVDRQSIRDLQLRRVQRDRRPELNLEWRLQLVAKDETGSLVGWATLGLVNAKTAALESTSWVVEAMRGQGVGTSIRHGVLALAFTGLQADVAISSPLTSNQPSIAASERLGYTYESWTPSTDKSSPAMFANLELTRRAWAPSSEPPRISGHETIRDWLIANVYP
jgi:RimJ/RimL family protein N-acetyltransferase